MIVLFYSGSVSAPWLFGAAASIATIVAMKRLSVRHALAYVLPAIVLWICVLESGVHATIAGVVLGMLTPARPVAGRQVIEPLEAPPASLVESGDRSTVRARERRRLPRR